MKLKNLILILLTIFSLFVFSSCANKTVSVLSATKQTSAEDQTKTKDQAKKLTTSSEEFNVDVSIKYHIFIDNKLKNVNPNIIRAARAAMFYTDVDFAKFQHFNGVNDDFDINIFEVKQISKKSWEVRYRAKQHNTGDYNKIGYSSVSVLEESTGKFTGYITHSSPLITGSENY